jgi:hypothetical protein
VGFQIIITNLQAQIFIVTHAFHGSSIKNHDFKVIENMHIEMGLLSNASMNKFIGVAFIDEDNDFMMLDIAN